MVSDVKGTIAFPIAREHTTAGVPGVGIGREGNAGTLAEHEESVIVLPLQAVPGDRLDFCSHYRTERNASLLQDAINTRTVALASQIGDEDGAIR
jgi:hypothetical protein